MFSFLKRHKPQDQFYQPEQLLTVREQALKLFSSIEGLDDIKEMMLRALESPERAHTLLTGPPVRNTKMVRANIVIFATSNGTERLSKPLISRFTIFEIPEYTYPEFEGISTRIVNKLPQNTIVQIASSVWKSGSRDIRDVLKIANLCNPSDGEEDISRLISIHQKYRKTSNDYNN